MATGSSGGERILATRRVVHHFALRWAPATTTASAMSAGLLLSVMGSVLVWSGLLGIGSEHLDVEKCRNEQSRMLVTGFHSKPQERMKSQRAMSHEPCLEQPKQGRPKPKQGRPKT